MAVDKKKKKEILDGYVMSLEEFIETSDIPMTLAISANRGVYLNEVNSITGGSETSVFNAAANVLGCVRRDEYTDAELDALIANDETYLAAQEAALTT